MMSAGKAAAAELDAWNRILCPIACELDKQERKAKKAWRETLIGCRTDQSFQSAFVQEENGKNDRQLKMNFKPNLLNFRIHAHLLKGSPHS